ncbi:hypothetical protein H9623_02095 [Oerskovia sp. Sa1BUA8]|uniref:Uncharacterized protein n=1 Tax=Oerskovia douganii TaxID=2762210 RepID=A0A9D5YX08_9CELL|nr:hypothetical protein [Oerskovia douganii]MBE7699098.1 hypothetical protein [Oerskovia douganii]
MTENLAGQAVPVPREAQRAAARRAAEQRSLRTAAWSMSVGTWQIGVWFWAIVLIIAGIIGYVEVRTDILDGSVIDGVVSGSAKFFLFVMGIITPLASIAVHVAAGGTRRSLIRSTWCTAVVLGLTFALVAAALGYVEWLVFRAQGWSPELDRAQLYADGGQVGTAFLVQLFFCSVYWLAGASIGMGYYRLGVWGGTFAIVPFLLPVVLVELAFQSGYFGRPFAQAVGLSDAQVLTAVIGGLVALVAAAFAFHLVTRSVAIAPVTS